MRTLLQPEADSVSHAYYVGMLMASKSIGAELVTAEVHLDPYCQYDLSRHIIS